MATYEKGMVLRMESCRLDTGSGGVTARLLLRFRFPVGDLAIWKRVEEQLEEKGVTVFPPNTFQAEVEKLMGMEIDRLQAEVDRLNRELTKERILVDALKAGLLPDKAAE